MNTSRPLLLGLGGLLLIILVAWVIVPLFEYRAAGETRLHRAKNRHATMLTLCQTASRLSQAPQQTTGPSLFSTINREAEQLGLAQNIETLRPSSRNGAEEGLELRISGLYLRQGVQWLHALEARPGVRIETLTLRRSAQNLLDIDMSVSHAGVTGAQ